MKSHRHGLVLGKFYPPHAGHHHLVTTAADRCERLTVLVCAASVESIPLADRVAWMREVHNSPGVRVVGAVDDVPMDLDDPAIWDAHLEIFRAAVPEPVDAVFTSEAYGTELGRRFGAESVCVDAERSLFPVSGTAVRQDPIAHWDFLGPPVRAALARRVVVLGAESTGTTTLARALADHYRERGGIWARTRYVAGVRQGVQRSQAGQAARTTPRCPLGAKCPSPAMTSPSSPTAAGAGGAGRPRGIARGVLRHRRLRHHRLARALPRRNS